MPRPIQRLTVQQFIDLLEASALTRKVDAVHVHHTFRPRRVDFRGLATIEAMRRFHMETRGWSDIAQHLTIDPTGHLWTGRDWNAPPASSSGHNGTAAKGPFMFEIIGDFDSGREVLDGAQRAATVDVIAALLRRFSLTPQAIRFHRELGSPKSCPGTSVDKQVLQDEVQARLPALPPPAGLAAPTPGDAGLFGREHVFGFEAGPVVAADRRADAEVPEHELAAREIERYAHEATAARQMREALTLTPADGSRGEDRKYEILRPHVVNLSRGELSEGGLYRMKPGSLEGIVDGIRQYAAIAPAPHVVLYAHGGLVSERGALDYAVNMKDWWLRHGVYPVFFVWESGLFEILRQFVAGPRAARDIFDFTSDPAIEMLAKIPGTAVWSGMKESARRASADDAGEGFAGGARLFAELLAPALQQLNAAGTTVSVHAVGHSAGAIFHAHLVPALQTLRVGLATLSFLAPAIRVDLFADKLLPLVTPDAAGNKAVQRFYLLTMEEDAERSDNCWQIYRKSLLYFVSNSFEGLRRRPILGLQESLRKDERMRTLFAIDRKRGRPVPGATSHGTLYLSFARGADPSDLTRSLRHGCFDNDRYTMSTVLRRIRGVGDDPPIGRDDFPFAATETCGFEARDFDAEALGAFRAERGVRSAAVRPATTRDAMRGRALCVGIDAYRQRPLAGCVADARLWGQTLASLGFDVTYLLDGDATRDGIVGALSALADLTRPGEVAVFQYSGHGSQVPDQDGDETDGFDEVFVPVDYHTGALLLDDDLAELLERLRPGAQLTLFMDCCHSGTNSRFAPALRPMVTDDDRVRFLPLDADVQAAHQAYRRSRGAARRSAAEKAVRGVVHFAACQDDEFAWESAGQGDFTAAAVPRLRRAVERHDSNAAYLHAVRAAVTGRGRQHPMLMPSQDGGEERPLLAPAGRHEPGTDPGAGPARPSAGDDKLLQHVEAIARILRSRADRGA